MKKPCEKCYSKLATMNWSARVVITERGSGEILASAYIDRLLNSDFYPADKRPEDALDDWPTCPDCGEPLKIDDPYEVEEVFNLPDVNLTPVWSLLGFLFLGLLLLLLLL